MATSSCKVSSRGLESALLSEPTVGKNKPEALYLTGEEGEGEEHADDGVAEYYYNKDPDKHYKGSD